MPAPEAILSIARQFLGTPFQHQGRRPGKGMDCVGLIVCVARELYGTLFDIQGYPRQPDGWSLRRHCAEYLQPLTRLEASPGDVVLIQFSSQPAHLGILGDRGRPLSLIHASSGRAGTLNRVIEHRLSRQWQERILAVYRFPEFWNGDQEVIQWDA